MKTVDRIFAIGAVLAGAVALVEPAFAANGVPLRGERCGVQLYQSNSVGVLMAKAVSGTAGSYHLTAYQSLPVNDIDINLTGRFAPSADGDAVLAQTSLQMGYVQPGGFRGMDEIRDAEYGQDADLIVQLDVYDLAGRLTCRSREVMLLPLQFLQARPTMQRRRASPTASQPENARAAQARIAQQRLAASRESTTLPPGVRSRFSLGRGSRHRD